MDGTFNSGVLEVIHGVHATGGAELVPGVIEIQKHDNPGFGIESRQCDEANPDGDAHVVSQQVEKPERPDEREGDGEQNDRRFYGGAGVQIDQNKDYQEREGNDHAQAMFSAFEVFELPSPLDVIPRRKLDGFADALGGRVYEAFDIIGGDVHEHEADKLPVFIADGGRAGLVGNVSEHADRNL